MKQTLLALALVFTLQPIWAQEDQSVDLLFSSGFTGIDLQEDSEVFTSNQNFASRFRVRSNSLYFFNPSVRKYSSLGFVEVGLKGVNYFQSDGAMQFRRLDTMGMAIFDSTSANSALGLSGSFYLGKSVTLAKVGANFRFYLGVEEALQFQYLKLSKIENGVPGEDRSFIGASTTSLTTTVSPRLSHKISNSVKLEAALPVRVFSFDFARTFENDAQANLSSNQGAFIMTAPWRVGLQVAVAIQIK